MKCQVYHEWSDSSRFNRSHLILQFPLARSIYTAWNIPVLLRQDTSKFAWWVMMTKKKKDSLKNTEPFLGWSTFHWFKSRPWIWKSEENHHRSIFQLNFLESMYRGSIDLLLENNARASTERNATFQSRNLSSHSLPRMPYLLLSTTSWGRRIKGNGTWKFSLSSFSLSKVELIILQLYCN